MERGLPGDTWEQPTHCKKDRLFLLFPQRLIFPTPFR